MKSQTAYITSLLKFCSSQGSVHCTWDQVGAATGRITSESPNLQVSYSCVVARRVYTVRGNFGAATGILKLCIK